MGGIRKREPAPAETLAILRRATDAYGSQGRVARELGISRETLWRLRNERMPLTPAMASLIRERLGPRDAASAPGEIDTMRSIEALDDAARSRVLTWALARWHR